MNLTTATPGLRRIVRWSAGVDQRRQLPRFADPAGAGAGGDRPRDRTGEAGGRLGGLVLRLLHRRRGRGGGRGAAAAGYAPQFLDRTACCGLTWISTGQREGARRQLRTSLDVLHPYVAAGVPDRRSGAVLHRGLAQRRARAAARRSAGGRGRRRVCSRWPSCWPGPRTGHRPDLSGGRDRGPAALPPRRGAGLAGRRRAAEALRRDGDHARRLLRPGRQLRGREGPLRRVGEGGRARPAARRRGPPERDRAGRRVLLPHPAGRAGRHDGDHAGRAAGPADARPTLTRVRAGRCGRAIPRSARSA